MEPWRGGKYVILMKHYIFPYSYIYIYKSDHIYVINLKSEQIFHGTQ